MPEIEAQPMPRAVIALLGFVAGFVDICSYFGLFGIYVAQLTGSFVLASARIVSGKEELMTLAAIPAFFIAGCAATAIAVTRGPGGRPLPFVLGLECLLLTAMLALASGEQPLASIEAPAAIAAILVGMAAMGVQSAMVRLFMKGAPSTNVMTTNTTQLAIDATTTLLWCWGKGDAGQAAAARGRLTAYVPPIGGFIGGTAAGAVSFHFVGIVALAAPLAAAYVLLGWMVWRRD